ncbi:MAG TPA: acyl-CoA thioesterase II [Acidimicrobiales bacterium]|nr:acyl-CoA thioesterase II [Acidimicrobiales bacterium]
MSQAAVDDLIELLDLEPIEVNIFRGVSPKDDRQRVFGGQVAGQALVAAARTVGDDRLVHSMHAYFLRPGDPSIPILYEVDRIRDGRSFTTRRVVAIQHGQAIFNLSTSFQVPEEGLEHDFEMPEVPPPDGLPDRRARMARFADKLGDLLDRPQSIDTRVVDWDFDDRAEALPPFQRVWLRADGKLPDDPLLHTIVLTAASDMTLLDTALLPHGGSWFEPTLFMASLDHAMWFHRPFRADQWLLYSQDTPNATSGRGLARGLVFTQEGTLVASVVQEGLIRVGRP